MRIGRRSGIAFSLVALMATGGALAGTLSLAQSSSATGSGDAAAGNETLVSAYHAPVGPELSVVAATEAAIKDVREDAQPGNLVLHTVHSTFSQANADVNADEGSATPQTGQASCFPGMRCTTAEIEEHARLRRELNESDVYVVEMTGTSFSPPASALKKGVSRESVSGSVETVIVNAHTGFNLSETIGGTRPNLERLGSVSELTATVPSTTTGQIHATMSSRGHRKLTLIKRKKRAHHG